MIWPTLPLGASQLPSGRARRGCNRISFRRVRPRELCRLPVSRGICRRVYFKLRQKNQGEPIQENQVEAGVEAKKLLLEIQDVGTPWAYISLTDVKGPTRLELRFESLSGAEVFFSAMFEVSSSDPLTSTQISFPLPRLPSKAGNYILELLYENISLGAHRVKISEIEDATSN